MNISPRFDEEQMEKSAQFSSTPNLKSTLNSISLPLKSARNNHRASFSKLRDDSATSATDDPLTLATLRRENVKLRTELKDLNQRLNSFIDLSDLHKRIKPVTDTDEALYTELESAKKKSVLYE